MAWHNHKIRVLDPATGLVRVLLGGAPGFAGDGGPAREARVNQPPHGVFDESGNFFLIDQRSQRIRVIHDFAARREEATVETVGGTGDAGFNGDGVALQTQFNFPAGTNPEPSGGITIDSDGVLYFSDTLNHRIRRVQFEAGDFRRGVVTTIAGTGDAGDSGDGGPALAAEINLPQDLEIGPDGKLYFADTNNHRVRRIDLTSGIIDAVAGTGEKGYGGEGGPALEAKLNRPFGIAFDRRGDLYIADTFNSRIRRVKLSTGGPTPVFPADYRESYVEVRDCRFSIEHGGVYIRVLADELGASAYLENRDPLPVGAVIVKEEFSDPGCADDTLIAWRAMRKEAPGFDLEDGDWHWQKVLPGREVILETKDTCIGCHRRPDCVRRDYMCTEPGAASRDELRLVLERQPSTLLSVSGMPAADEQGGHDDAAPFDIYAVGGDPGDGRGPYVLKYDGARWRRLMTGARGDLWWISERLIDGAFYLAGENGLIFRLDRGAESLERFETPGNELLYGVWGTDARHIWAVGGDLANEDRGGVPRLPVKTRPSKI